MLKHVFGDEAMNGTQTHATVQTF